LGRLGDFGVDLCGCFGDCDTTMYAMFLLPLRAMDTHISAGASLPWVWYSALLYAAVPLALPIWLFIQRSETRFRLGGARQRGCVCGDLLIVLCFPCCAVVQEARAVDMAAGAQTKCFLKLEFDESKACGAPVAVRQHGASLSHTGGERLSSAAGPSSRKDVTAVSVPESLRRSGEKK